MEMLFQNMCIYGLKTFFISNSLTCDRLLYTHDPEYNLKIIPKKPEFFLNKKAKRISIFYLMIKVTCINNK